MGEARWWTRSQKEGYALVEEGDLSNGEGSFSSSTSGSTDLSRPCGSLEMFLRMICLFMFLSGASMFFIAYFQGTSDVECTRKLSIWCKPSSLGLMKVKRDTNNVVVLISPNS